MIVLAPTVAVLLVALFLLYLDRQEARWEDERANWQIERSTLLTRIQHPHITQPDAVRQEFEHQIPDDEYHLAGRYLPDDHGEPNSSSDD